MNIDYPLEQRTLVFGKEVVRVCRELPKDRITNPLVGQFIRSATSVGANYREANAASSGKDFRNKIHICKKEAQETDYWLSLLIESCPAKQIVLQKLQNENKEFILIFGKIISTINKNSKLEIRN